MKNWQSFSISLVVVKLSLIFSVGPLDATQYCTEILFNKLCIPLIGFSSVLKLSLIHI